MCLCIWSWFSVPLRGHTVHCARAVRKVGCFPPPVASFLGCMIGMGTHTALSQCTIAIVHNCSIIPPPLLVCTVASGHSEQGLW